MNLYLHKSLCDLKKAGQLSSSAGKSGTGSQRGGTYLERVQEGYTKDNKPKYRYLRTAEERDAYYRHKTKSKKKSDEDEKENEEKKQSKEKSDEKRAETAASKIKGPSLFVARGKKDKN